MLAAYGFLAVHSHVNRIINGILALNTLLLCSCGGGSGSSGGSGDSASVGAAPSDIAGVWWAVDGSPAYALNVQQSGNLLQLGDEQAQIEGSSITMTSIGGSGSVNSSADTMSLSWEFPGYGTVNTSYQQIEDVIASASTVSLPHYESVNLSTLCVRSFTITDEEFVSIETSGPSNGDTWLFVIDENFNLVADADDPGTNFYAFVEQTLPAGTYYVLCTAWTDNLTIDLDITVAAGG